tara:strand:- start:453 stop:1175 length:723 start_codon:yes stop_codon:yes gene_type:complete
MQTIRFENFNFFPDQKILDIGCGQGRHCFGAYMHAHLHVYGIDMGLDDVKKANENFNQFKESENEKSCNFMVGNAKNLPFEENTFDHVVCSEVLEHIIDYESALKEIKRVLKPDGTFALSVPKFFPEWVCWKLSKDYQNEPGGHVRIFKYKELKNSVSTLGFKFYKRHWAHALHSPYWWMQCFFWETKNKSKLISLYHSFLVWDMTKNPFITRLLEFLLQPIIGKSVVMYFQNIEGEIER